MGILEDFEKMIFLQQMQGQGGNQGAQMQPVNYDMQSMQQPQPQQMGQRSPIESGSDAAVESARRSLAMKKRILAMDDDESQRALGKAFLMMQNSMRNNPTYGDSTSGNINAILGGINDGLLNYDQERERIANANDVLLRQEKEEQALARKEDREMKRMNHEMEMARKNLSINQGYFNLKKSELEQEKKLEEEMTKAGVDIPLGRLSNHPSMYNNAMADIKSLLEKRDTSIPALQAIDTIENVLTRDPDVTKHWGVIALAAQRKDPGYVNQQLANKVPEKTRYHAELLAKSLATLPVSKFKGIPAKGLTVFAEKLISGMSPSMDMSSKSILKMIKPDKKFYTHNIESGDIVYEKLQQGIRHIPKPMALELDKWDEEEAQNPYLGLPDEELAAKEAELMKQLGGS
jgi:hypothetical protein